MNRVDPAPAASELKAAAPDTKLLGSATAKLTKLLELGTSAVVAAALMFMADVANGATAGQ
jgi:hypothetical protein